MTEVLARRPAASRAGGPETAEGPGHPSGGAVGPIGRRRSLPRVLTVAVALAVLLVLATALSLTVGARNTGLPVVWDALTAFDPADGDHLVVHSRIPRTVAGLLAGLALALAGTALQGITRNPLADPGILGLNAGAALAVVLGIHLAGIAGVTGFVWLGFGGCALAAVTVYAVASLGREGATPVKLALAGAALTAGCTSVMHGVLMIDQTALDSFRFWQVGTLGVRSTETMVSLLPFLAVGTAVCLLSARLFNALALGDDAAAGLGLRVGRGRGIAAAGVVLLVGTAVAIAGPIAFVGLVIPHGLRVLVGSDYRALLPLSALAGPVLLLLADAFGRVVLPPSEVQVGVMTAVIGAPVFIWLIRTRKQVAL
ncbi:iron ABC transporter permease [Zhihengliuella sp.]|uniref:FecCD family ABC transporter permease n=1 Tax=Zhihengliuella sp. TaxID=1954483 RepID=UPI00281280D1|nr:iron ABC transporter permease [Zhihengliuella sp.]